MLAHIQLRNQFADFSIVYIEYFYILMYITAGRRNGEYLPVFN